MTGKSVKRVAVFISGRGSNLGALIAASAAQDCPYRIVAVLSDNPEAGGLALAARENIETFAIPRSGFGSRSAHEAAVLDALSSIEPDIICLAGYMRLLSAEFVGQWKGRILNIHPSLLPNLPGLETHKRALSLGMRIHGCTVHFVNEGMDDGPIIGQAAVVVRPDDDENALAARVLKAEHRLYPEMLRLAATDRIRMSSGGETIFDDASAPDCDDVVLISPIEGTKR
ncbi:phosphoribosylglycinamide formyltransferase [Hoeflea sp. WL0058]|uniref:Phosphoribosylglycinamide formyltransferase n=1 Tax=Flavimaribacter sediminis TaxID=2865987 RepID=A0AAE2ZN20_9HYPH|nr:phosphoribosylglycinamide formyltransferase [Flavimaribacter sediminis]MBW8639663.1 phosphoribosylglycinamide formyltransferase [Flavimaribacter sediminis]